MEKRRFIPGTQDGKGINMDLTNQDKARKGVHFGKKCKGFYIQLTQGQTTEQQIQISGTAWNLLGFCIVAIDQMNAPQDLSLNTFTFLQDNEVIIQDANMMTFAKGNGNSASIYMYEYYPYERPLTATSNLRFTFYSAVTMNITLNIYYQ